jgi:Acetyltransferase (GNAT) domain
MKLIQYEPIDFKSGPGLFLFLKSLYSDKTNFDFFLAEYERAYTYCLTSEDIKFLPLAIIQNEKMVAHVALIVDDRLPKGQAFFGFFDIVEDRSLFELIWQELEKLALKHDIQILKGPVNGSIWHQYRCLKESSSISFFKTEPCTPLYYYSFLSQAKPLTEITYSSGIRDSYTDILEMLKQQKELVESKLSRGDFKIEVTKTATVRELLAIAELSATVFDKKSWGYTKLSRREFSSLYDLDKINDNLDKLFLLYHQETLVGYCSTIREGDNLICKTICIASEFQGIGLGNALALKLHEEAMQDDIEKIMYVLIRDGNQVHNYPTEDVKIFRRYAVFDYKIEK